MSFGSSELFKDILKLAKDHGYKENYSPGLLGAIFFILYIINNGVGNTEAEIDYLVLLAISAIIIFFIVLTMTPVVNAMNYYLKNNHEVTDKFNIKTNKSLIGILVLIFCFYIGYTYEYRNP
mgnify:CR=1 FL=1